MSGRPSSKDRCEFSFVRNYQNHSLYFILKMKMYEVHTSFATFKNYCGVCLLKKYFNLSFENVIHI